MHTSSHILDNPVWNALQSGNTSLAKGGDDAMYFDSEVSPFIALRDIDSICFESLYAQRGYGDINILACTNAIELPKQWEVIAVAQGYQMIYSRPAGEIQLSGIALTNLSTQDVSDMVDLAKLCNPGPFGKRTIAFGHYQGVWQNHELVAMAGQRMQPYSYAEISAVCTHPGHTGKGFAGELLVAQIIRMQAANLTPFLHVRYDNERAIKLYKQLGFVIRSDMYFHIFKKR